MLFPLLILFFLFILLSAFFSSSETAFVASNPYKIDYLEKKGSKKARLVKKMLAKVDHLLATILVGNTLVNTAAASIATFLLVSFMPEKKNQAILLATIITTFLILVFSEITPKTYAAYNPLKLSFLFVRPLKFFIVIFYPFVKAFTFLTRLLFPSGKSVSGSSALNEEEVKVLLTVGVKGISSLRRKMLSGVLDIGSKPVREIMVPRPQVKALEMESSLEDVLGLIRTAGYSRFPVYKGRLDNIEGVIHAKDIISYLVENKDFTISQIVRKPVFVPEFAPLEKVMRQMQEGANHLVFVVDEFGNMEGIATLEDIIEEIVGEIQDEYDGQIEEWLTKLEEDVYLVKGNSSVKELNKRLPIDLPERGQYMTLTGFALYELGRIPQEGDSFVYRKNRFSVEKMIKRHITLIRIQLHRGSQDEEEAENESYS